MALHVPTRTKFPSGVITIISNDDTSYESIQESVGNYIYEIKKVYLKSDDLQQILIPISFRKYDVNGNVEVVRAIPTVDPTQYQPSLNIEFDSNKYVLDGHLNISYSINPNEVVFFYLDVVTLNKADALKGDTGMPTDFLKTYDFFENYQDKIKLEF